MIAIVDYGVGNLFSLSNSFAAVGADAEVTSDPKKIKEAEKIILPGVGAFMDAAAKLKESGLDRVVLDETAKGKYLFGICLGMQMLFKRSFEYGVWEGLGLLNGEIRSISEFAPPSYKIPHMGWNALSFKKDSPLLKYVKEGDCTYFVHSYCASGCDDSLIASVEYGADIPAVVGKDNVMGCQFHPEKSGEVGLNILKAFCEMK